MSSNLAWTAASTQTEHSGRAVRSLDTPAAVTLVPTKSKNKAFKLHQAWNGLIVDLGLPEVQLGEVCPSFVKCADPAEVTGVKSRFRSSIPGISATLRIPSSLSRPHTDSHNSPGERRPGKGRQSRPVDAGARDGKVLSDFKSPKGAGRASVT